MQCRHSSAPWSPPKKPLNSRFFQQCTRLGHICDYRPRLAFRDDTPRIMGRMADVKTEGNHIWDRKRSTTWPSESRLTVNIVSSPTPSEDNRSDYFSPRDSLPAFALLTSDEDRERKAEASSPGTYHVVVIPDSFSSLPEYADDLEKPIVTSTEISSSVASSPTGHMPVHHPNDPNVVILKTFEDVARRSPSAGRTSRISPTSEISDPFCALSLSPILDSLPSPVMLEDDKLSFFDASFDQESQDHALFSHFRHVVWKQLFPHDRGQDDSFGYESSGMTLSVDFLEREAALFPPVSAAVSSNWSYDVLILVLFSSPTLSWRFRHSVCRTVALARMSTRCSTINKPSLLSSLVCATTMISCQTACFSLISYS